MYPNRLVQQLESPAAAAPQPSPAAFVLWQPGSCFPVSAEMLQWQQALYQLAFEQARQMLRPSLVERDWLGVWN